MFFLYVIFSAKLNRYYVGYTADLEKRLTEHNTGLSHFTAKAADWTLMYKEEYNTREEANQRERNIKKKKSRKYIEWLICNDKID